LSEAKQILKKNGFICEADDTEVESIVDSLVKKYNLTVEKKKVPIATYYNFYIEMPGVILPHKQVIEMIVFDDKSRDIVYNVRPQCKIDVYGDIVTLPYYTKCEDLEKLEDILDNEYLPSLAKAKQKLKVNDISKSRKEYAIKWSKTNIEEKWL